MANTVLNVKFKEEPRPIEYVDVRLDLNTIKAIIAISYRIGGISKYRNGFQDLSNLLQHKTGIYSSKLDHLHDDTNARSSIQLKDL